MYIDGAKVSARNVRGCITYAKAATGYLAQQHQLAIKVEIIRDERAWAQWCPRTDERTIRYGDKGLVLAATYGFTEYSAIEDLIFPIGAKRPTGFEAIYYLVCHEVAHHLVGIAMLHTRTFVLAMRALLDTYPYTACATR